MSAENNQWIQASDEVVRERLTAELAKHKNARSPALEGGEAGAATDHRRVFLEATKAFHPSRYARRPRDIRKLANEVYILIKEAYETEEVYPEQDSTSRRSKRADTDDAYEKLQQARAFLGGTSKSESGGVSAEDTSSVGPNSSGSRKSAEGEPTATRLEQEKRRRERLKKGLVINQSNGVPRSAQIRTATDPHLMCPTDRDMEEIEFQNALSELQSSHFSNAAQLFKKLAVARPAEKRYRMHMHYSQGRWYQMEGREKDARSEFKRALGLDASFTLAHKALATLGDENGAQKNGIFSRLFGK